MSKIDRWILPDGIDEILPPEANQIEQLRRKILDQIALWGYQLVHPPLAEYLESLLTGIGHDLDLLTFKLTDQQTGRMMGLSADTSQQVARMDAHSIKREGPARYCYSTPLLHTRPAHLQASRSPIQIGAELFGVRDVSSDTEIVSLMLSVMEHIGIRNMMLDLGHVSVYRSVIQYLKLDSDLEAELYTILRHRSAPELKQFIAEHEGRIPDLDMVAQLAQLAGDETVLDKADSLFSDRIPEISRHLKRLRAIAATVRDHFPDVELHFDLAELKDYNYHTGLILSLFVEGLAQPIARGGRYDNTGKVFGRARPATGFSSDLKLLAKLAENICDQEKIFAPYAADSGLANRIEELRKTGQIVIQALSDQDSAMQSGCTAQLQQDAEGNWQVINIKQHNAQV